MPAKYVEITERDIIVHRRAEQRRIEIGKAEVIAALRDRDPSRGRSKGRVARGSGTHRCCHRRSGPWPAEE
ncbi:MAG: hypothetical protein MZV63_53110 [Marinilabiliales bacterium]|nr:hypothetical protein [Marinilabiliales bacterium]